MDHSSLDHVDREGDIFGNLAGNAHGHICLFMSFCMSAFIDLSHASISGQGQDPVLSVTDSAENIQSSLEIFAS